MVSLFNIIEKVTIFEGKLEVQGNPPPPHSIVLPTFPFRVVATWIRTPDDSDDTVFEVQVVIIGVDGKETIVGQASTPFGVGKQTFRVISDVDGPLPFGDTEGVVMVAARLRRQGESEWGLQQSYPIVVSVGAQSEPQA